MRARSIALYVIAAGAIVIGSSPGRPEDRTLFRSHQIAAQSAIAPLSQLVEQIPDGAELIDLYKAARTVADVETANGKVKGEVAGGGERTAKPGSLDQQTAPQAAQAARQPGVQTRYDFSSILAATV